MAKRNVYKGGSSARDYDLFNSKLQYNWITPQLERATAISDKTLREEYSRLRAIANKRIKRMQGHPEAAGTLSQLPESFPSVRGMSRGEIVQNLGDVANFLVAGRGSLSGIRSTNKRIRESLEKKGINVSPDQLNKFGPFMNKVKKALGIQRGEYASSQLASIWNELMEGGKISQKKFSEAMVSLMSDIQEERGLSEAQERAARKLVRSTNLSEYFGEFALDKRTLSAERRRKKRAR